MTKLEKGRELLEKRRLAVIELAGVGVGDSTKERAAVALIDQEILELSGYVELDELDNADN